jgi:hypothetical protein
MVHAPNGSGGLAEDGVEHGLRVRLCSAFCGRLRRTKEGKAKTEDGKKADGKWEGKPK